jgi:hypothetical protein
VNRVDQLVIKCNLPDSALTCGMPGFGDSNNTIRGLMFSQRRWWFKSSGTWRRVNWYISTNVLEEFCHRVQGSSRHEKLILEKFLKDIDFRLLLCRAEQSKPSYILKFRPFQWPFGMRDVKSNLMKSTWQLVAQMGRKILNRRKTWREETTS